MVEHPRTPVPGPLPPGSSPTLPSPTLPSPTLPPLSPPPYYPPPRSPPPLSSPPPLPHPLPMLWRVHCCMTAPTRPAHSLSDCCTAWQTRPSAEGCDLGRVTLTRREPGELRGVPCKPPTGSALGLHGNQIVAPAVTPAHCHPGHRSDGSLLPGGQGVFPQTPHKLMEGWIKNDEMITLLGRRGGTSSTHVSTSAWQVASRVWTRGRPVCGAVVDGGRLSSEPHPDGLRGIPLYRIPQEVKPSLQLPALSG